MQSIPLTKHQLFAISILIACCGLLLFFSINRHNTTFFVAEKKQKESTTHTSIDIIPISSNDPILGSPAAPITVIGFEDFLCESCRTQNLLINQLLERYPAQVKFIWKDLPITTIPVSSEIAHIYGYCMHEQGLFEPYKTTVFNQIFTTTLTSSELDPISTELGADMDALEACRNSQAPRTHIEKNTLLAQALQIQRVPTFFINGQQIQTPTSLNEWIGILGLE